MCLLRINETLCKEALDVLASDRVVYALDQCYFFAFVSNSVSNNVTKTLVTSKCFFYFQERILMDCFVLITLCSVIQSNLFLSVLVLYFACLSVNFSQ